MELFESKKKKKVLRLRDLKDGDTFRYWNEESIWMVVSVIGKTYVIALGDGSGDIPNPEDAVVRVTVTGEWSDGQ